MPVALALSTSAALFAAPSGATAASRAALPDGTHLTALDRLTGAFSEVDPDTAALTPDGGATGTMFADLDVDDDGRGYAITFGPGTGETFVPSTIQAVDLVQGTASLPVTIVHTDGSPAACSTIDYTAGTVLADCVLDRLGVPASLFGTIDPATGTLTTIWEYAATFTDLVGGLATDPTTGDVYVFSGPNIFRVDLTAQTLEIVVTTMAATVIQGDFDQTGVYWATLDAGVANAWGLDTALAIVDLTTGAQDVRGSLDTGGDPTSPSAWGLTIWGTAPAPALVPAAPTLPPTGAHVDAGAAVLGVLALSVGVAVATRRRGATR